MWERDGGVTEELIWVVIEFGFGQRFNIVAGYTPLSLPVAMFSKILIIEFQYRSLFLPYKTASVNHTSVL